MKIKELHKKNPLDILNNLEFDELKEIPLANYKNNDKYLICTGIIALPLDKRHNSSMGTMDFLAHDDQGYITRLTSDYDILSINLRSNLMDTLKNFPNSLEVDCLYRSKCLRIFIRNNPEISKYFFKIKTFLDVEFSAQFINEDSIDFKVLKKEGKLITPKDL